MSGAWDAVLAVPVAAGTGLLSAWVPVVNAEAAVAAAALTLTSVAAVGVTLAVAVGQTAGKVVLFEAARRGSARRERHRRDRTPPEWQRSLLDGMRGRRRGNAVVLLSATVGMPPLAVVSVAAGGLRGRITDFVVCCLLGRTARFLTMLLALWWARH